ncbi:STAS domain-containing protein [Aequorivita echinoideorum]|uniref:STAS domain-containing protein n=1 Tax=Aequorivita echinoideorum TaxID=1549647 RepID=A0ABS5S6G5_9FLAO|nr:STAS domain-containing protein [Aequorivita echinoideorum]MBT0608810.1 STAS domain-containing protein [Aequorivita echinoideorum]
MKIHFLTQHVAHLEGKLYSGNLSEVQQRIESALDKTQYLVIDLDPLYSFDISCACMLYMISKKAAENNKVLILLCTENRIVTRILSKLGISYFNSVPEIDFTEPVVFYKSDK